MSEKFHAGKILEASYGAENLKCLENIAVYIVPQIGGILEAFYGDENVKPAYREDSAAEGQIKCGGAIG